MTAETAAFAAPREASRTVSFGWLWTPGLLLILTFLVIYPVSMLLLGALTNTNPVVDGFGVLNLSLTNFITVLGNPNVRVLARPKKTDSAEVFIGDEFIAVLFLEEGGKSFAFQMAILDSDVE